MEDKCRNQGKLLLHACCGPCSMEPVRLLRERGVDPVIYYANSNIHPSEEYAKRLETLAFWAQDESLEVVEGPYDPQSWEETAGSIGEHTREAFGIIVHEADAAPLTDSPGEDGGASAADTPSAAEAARQARCRACYRLRFQQTARYAADHGFDAIGTTLSVSPYQYTAIIREELERAAENVGVTALFEDYRPYYDNATQRSREAGMYRQNYCACRFSAEEAQVERDMRKLARKVAREAQLAETAERRAAEDQARAANRAEKAAYADKQARKRAILRKMREERQAHDTDS